MKRILSLSLLAIMLSACASQPASAISADEAATIFGLGFWTGTYPVLGQATAALLMVGAALINSGAKKPVGEVVAENVSFVAGHALGMSLWAVPLYLVIRNSLNK
jgi:hypothetical protein